ncbi:uncharacterized protein L3040_009024 [Drepanopeziza brunnea f. sp. 'multigermtubi']|uniref:uncharacterized protein n=1 Tax=Drepanopeziza brunnea f. sp. 'multigermtubi' TaxID=698441 RepID=UPI0023891DE0|nr:hypothetical protein L3040_009024 [Drepanopeziza brunnea f. sp. 'multigermtubi']
MAYNENVEAFRDVEYPMMRGKVYLDHGGTTIYAKSLIEDFSQKMIHNLYGNPHSASDPAMLSGHLVDSIRIQALSFFGADPEHFDLVFTANATAAIKLVAEGFQDLAASNPRSPSFWYGYHKDAHTSLVGIREMTDQGNHYCFTSDDEVEDFLNGKVGPTGKLHNTEVLPALFAYPGQSNMTGRRLPLEWTQRLRQSNLQSHQNTYSLLDAAALAMTTQLDFSDPDTAPDFTSVSFYKIFGFPDLGALIIRKDSGHIMKWRKYFGGGTVNALTVMHEATVQRRDANLHDGLEDGTLPFHSIIALGCAIGVHRKLYGSMINVSQHTCFLIHRLFHGMNQLTHYNGNPLFRVYYDPERSAYGDAKTQGATLAFSVLKADGTFVGHSEVESKANERAIYLRAGGLCNPGGIASYLQMEPWQFKRAWSAGHRCGDRHVEVINGKPMGVARASIGAMTTISDVDALLAFFDEVFVENLDLVMPMARAEVLRHKNFAALNMNLRSDSGIGSVKNLARFHVPGQINARRMISSPNLRAPVQTDGRIYLRPSLHEHRPNTGTTYASHTSVAALAHRPPPLSYNGNLQQQRADTARTMMVPIEGLRLPESYDGSFNEHGFSREFHPLMQSQTQQQLNVDSQKGRKKFKFWKCKKATKARR